MNLLQHGLIFLAWQAQVPSISSELVEMAEGSAKTGQHEYSVVLPDRLRGRHFAFVVDRSACQGDILVNDHKLLTLDADEVFAFDRGNRVRLEGCLERTPAPLALYAHPKVFVEEGRAVWSVATQTLRLEIRLRNTLDNSVSVNLTARELSGWDASFFLGPQTSQTRTFVVRLERQVKQIRLEMLKLEEAIEGAYRHIRILPVTRLNE
jgi:hypothetical protein